MTDKRAHYPMANASNELAVAYTNMQLNLVQNRGSLRSCRENMYSGVESGALLRLGFVLRCQVYLHMLHQGPVLRCRVCLRRGSRLRGTHGRSSAPPPQSHVVAKTKKINARNGYSWCLPCYIGPHCEYININIVLLQMM